MSSYHEKKRRLYYTTIAFRIIKNKLVENEMILIAVLNYALESMDFHSD